MSNSKTDKLKGKIRCPICNQDYSLDELTALGDSYDEENRSSQKAFHLFCHRCNSSAIIFIFENETGTLIAGTATDLNLREVYRFATAKAIDNEEIIRAYKFFNNNNLNKIQTKYE